MQIPGSEQWADGPGLRALDQGSVGWIFEHPLPLFNGLIITMRPIS